jgi:outer membrane receptor protein involved in Fe transport
MRISTCVFALASGVVTIVGAVPAAAQSQEIQEVIVTGSRIARPNLESTVPITSVSGEEIFQSGNTAVGDMLNDLPSLRSTISQSNSSRFLGTTGLNLLDLRGLDTQRTLVLVNGRRHVGADILRNAVSPDINTFPSDLIERIDVVTGGNSAVYGSDAIAGVVNFVLKRDFEGMQVRAQGGNSAEGDAGDYYASFLAGTNFSDGRGNIAANIEYAKQEPLFASERSNLRRQQSFITGDSDPAGSPNGADAVPDRVFYNDVRSATIANGGSLLLVPTAASNLAPCGRDSLGQAYGCSFLFQQDGSLTPQTGTRIGLAPNGNYNGGNGTNNREGRALGVFPKLERSSFNVLGHLTISDAFEPFIEAKYVRTDSMRYGQPAFFQGGTIEAARERPRFDNPFLTDAARAQIAAAYTSVGLPAPTASTQLLLRRNLLDLGGRREDATRETSRVVLGVTGEFAENWNYEVSVNYGRFKEDTDVLGNLNQQRFLLAMDSTRNAAGNIVCRSQIDPAAARIYDTGSDAGNAFATSLLANDVASCVPLNPFGNGSITPAMRNYLTQDTTSVAEIEQFVTTALISGDSQKWFELPAGPVGVAFGLEHRTEENFFKSDDLVENGVTFYNALPLFDPPKFEVDEAFAEFRIPLLSDKTMARELTFNAAGRYAEYKGATGNVFAHNLGMEWAPIDSLRFRVGKARAVRAPNLVDLYSALGQNFAGNFTDPCSARNIGAGSATRAANCAAAGIPTTYDYAYTASLEIRSGGNPTLTEETSDSFTAGLVFRPTFLPNLSLSVDYFDIDIDDVITAPAAQDILNACYDAASLDNQFCGLFQRAGAGGGPRGEIPGRVLEGSLQQVTLNYASSTSRGIDLEAAFRQDLGSFGRLNTRLVYTRTLQRDDFLDPSDPDNADQILLELGDPRDAFNLSADVARGALTLGYELRYIGKMVLNQYEDTYGLQGNPPQNADYATRRYYPSVVYHDVRASYDFSDSLNAYIGVDNVADKLPPLDLGTPTGLTAAGGGIYEQRGRFFFAGAKYSFGGSAR